MLPPGPVMADILSPVVDHGTDPLAMQYFVKVSQSPVTLILPGSPAAAHKYQGTVVLADPWMILRHIRKETLHRIVVQRTVHPAMVIVRRIIYPGKRDQTVKQLRPPEKRDRGLRRPHIDPHHKRTHPRRSELFNKRKDLIHDKAVIAFLPCASPCVDAILTIPALIIYCFYAEELHLSVFEICPEGMRNAEVLVIGTWSALCGKPEKRHPRMSIMNDMHLLIKVAAVNNMLVTLHLPASVSILPHSDQFICFFGSM